MGNANGREEDGFRDESQQVGILHNGGRSVASIESMSASVSPPHSPAPSNSPLLFAPQVPVAPLQRTDGPTHLNQMWGNESHGMVDYTTEQRIPIIITWNYGGSDVYVEGSWDNWASRKQLQRSGTDHSILLVLPEGVYHYKFIVDGEWRYIPDLPYVADEVGRFCNLLDVNDYVPENLDSVKQFEAPPSPDNSYSQTLPVEEDFAKEPVLVPPQLHLTLLDMDNTDEASSSKQQHVVLNHLFIEKGCASQSLIALGMTHRFQSKYVTVVLYKPRKR
ncbi:hypothetical protein K2173_013776 [Erythroxylum novogranatense]|uniref:Association with the SNF1 complex (ASC) domain-containing protein n=1 Tax=Erythroxylum novogranatense TaxID=1862640 RepID=A0AAV8SCB1_9ROSI|nr:hypothetical protein K2173_013776 [Erythroxylum novogranatense]